ncbi:MAG: glycosyltransferase family 87 protein [Halobacteriales archaeon]
MGDVSMDWRGPRLVLAAGILAGLFQAVFLPRVNPEQLAIATDVYHHAAAAALSGGDPYAVTPPDHPGFRFLYPPVVLAVLLPYGPLGPDLAYAAQTGVNLLTIGAITVLLVRTVEIGGVDLPRIDRLLVAGFAFGSAGMVTNLVNGQVNPQLVLGIAGGAVLLERGREAHSGVAFALAATVKLFPALLGAWLLRARAWRAIGAAVATGLGGLVLGVLVWGPDLTATYVTVALPREASTATFAGGADPTAPQMTVRRQIAFLAPWLSGSLLFPVAVTVLAPVVLAASRTMATLRDRLVALQATLLATLSLFSLEPFYLSLAVFPVVPLLYLLEGRWPRRLFFLGALVAFVPVTLSTVEVWIETLSTGPGVAATLRSVARTAFAFALPPTYGVWLMLAGCVAHQNRSY